MMNLKSIALALFLVMTTVAVDAEDTRDFEEGVEEDFVVVLKKRDAKELAAEEDKTQKYILIIGQNSILKKQDLMAIKTCIGDLTSAADKKKAIKVFDFDGTDVDSQVNELKKTVHGLACQVHKADKAGDPLEAKLTTPHYDEDLADFVSTKLKECLSWHLNKSNMREVKTRTPEFVIKAKQDAHYCPDES
jgi:hypothetical protein